METVAGLGIKLNKNRIVQRPVATKSKGEEENAESSFS
jgi:hypothetical protein